MLDITSRAYTTMMRSHVGSIRSVAVDPLCKHIATVSEDHTIRVWDSDSLQQVSMTLSVSTNQVCGLVCLFESCSYIRSCQVSFVGNSSSSCVFYMPQHYGGDIDLLWAVCQCVPKSCLNWKC